MPATPTTEAPHPNAPVASLGSRALRGLSWNYAGTVGRIAATFFSQILLARLLGPEQFGLFGYAFLSVTMLALVVDMGLPLALVQIKVLDDDTLSTALARLLAVAALAALGLFAAADLVAQYIFSAPQAAPVLRAMAPTLVVGVAAAVITAVISRDIEFKVIQLAGLGSYILGYLVVGVGAALAGWGVWSLVLAWHVQTISACAAMYWFSPRRVRIGNPFRPLAAAPFGAVVMVTNIVNWLIDSGPQVAIGRWLGAAQLGQYSVANNLVRVPADHLVRSVQSVLMALASRAQGDDAAIRRAYLTVLSAVAVLTFPAFTYVLLTAKTIVELLLGAQWSDSGLVLVPLSIAMICHAVEALVGPILSGRGEPRAELRIKVVTLLVMAGVLAYAATISVVAVGWGVAFVYLFRWVTMSTALMRRLHIPVGSVLLLLRGPLLLALACVAAVEGVFALLHAASLPLSPLWVLIAAAVASAIVVLALVAALPRFVLGNHLLVQVGKAMKSRPSLATLPGLQRIAASAAQAVA